MEIKFLNELRESWNLFKNMVYLSSVVFLTVFKSVFVSLRNIIKFSLCAPYTPLGECIRKYFIFVPLYCLLLLYICIYITTIGHCIFLPYPAAFLNSFIVYSHVVANKR